MCDKKCLLCAQKNGPKEVWISLVLDPTTLDMQQSLFVLIMKNNSKGAMVEPHPSNPFISVWRQLTTSQIVVQRMLKYIKLIELQLCKFSALWKMNIILVHWVLWKQIRELIDNTFGCCHSNVCSKFQNFWNFPYDQTIKEWEVAHS